MARAFKITRVHEGEFIYRGRTVYRAGKRQDNHLGAWKIRDGFRDIPAHSAAHARRVIDDLIDTRPEFKHLVTTFRDYPGYVR